ADGDRELDRRIERRDGFGAAAAASPEHEPAQDGNVLIPGELIAARRAARARPHDRQFARPAHNADVEERPEARAEEEGREPHEAWRNVDQLRRIHRSACIAARVAACASTRPRPSAYSRMPEATATLRDSAPAAIGTATNRSQRARAASLRPAP